MIDPIKYLDERNSYIIPAIPHPESTCKKCRGTKNDAYSLCWNCGRDQSPENDPDLLGIGIFAQADEQAGSIMSRYKGSPSQQLEARIVVQCLAMRGIENAARFQPDIVTTIPSLRSRRGPHPLHILTRRAAELVDRTLSVEVLLRPGENVTNRRSSNSGNFAVPDSHLVQGRRVLLIDDTWVSGGHFRAATGALKSAGASQVIGLVIARWFHKGNDYHERDILRHAEANHTSFKDFDFFQETREPFSVSSPFGG